MKAIAAAWPERVSEAAYRDGDWILRIDDTWFAWANGRLLPEVDRARWQEFVPLAFYDYSRGLPPLETPDAATAARLRQSVRDAANNPPRRSEAFLGTLLRAEDRQATEAHLVRMEVGGFSVTVHESLRAPLTAVSERLRALRASDPVVAAFLRGLSEMNGYNYRYVEGTRSRSLHSYGLAVDLIPRSYGGKQAYWQWAMSKVPDWWTIPYEKRWMVPLAVIEAFEGQGFVWGGKWLYFDTMHFEFRPDILLRAGQAGRPAVPAEDPQSCRVSEGLEELVRALLEGRGGGPVVEPHNHAEPAVQGLVQERGEEPQVRPAVDP